LIGDPDKMKFNGPTLAVIKNLSFHNRIFGADRFVSDYSQMALAASAPTRPSQATKQ
jgi:hypothetical protein